MAPTGRPLSMVLTVLLAAEILANVTLIVGEPLDAVVVMLVAVPLAALATALLALGCPAVPRRSRAWLARLTVPHNQVVATAGGLVLAAGLYASNRLLTDLPLGPRTRIGYALAMAAAVAAMLAARTLLEHSRYRAALDRLPRWSVSAATLSLCGLLAALTDQKVLPPGFPRLHMAATFAAAALFSAVALLVTRHLRRSAVALIVGFNALLVLSIGWAGHEKRHQIITTRTPWVGYWQVIDGLRRASDRDGDGYGTFLGGEDCDDGDATAYPLSPQGRDCLGWVPAGPPPPVVPLAFPSPAQGPGIVVIVTIDTFRCGFRRLPERPALRDACPELTQLAEAGAARLDAHTRAPVTEPAITAMHFGDLDAGGEPLASLLGQGGYRSHAISTHRVLLANPRLRRAFSSTDESLVPLAVPPGSVTAPAVTDRALAWLRQAEQGSDKLFLWAHYLDPHAPYAIEPGATFVFDQLEAYAAEIRRTDREIGRLAQGLAALRRSAEVLLVVSADHGEGFGLHRLERHSVELYETSVRVPFIAWSPGPAPARFVTAPLPGSLVETRPFLMALLGGPSFVPRPAQVMVTLFTEDRQVAILRDGWKLIHHLRPGYDELYHLADDPSELHDLAASRPDEVRRLGLLLGAEMHRDPSLRALVEIR